MMGDKPVNKLKVKHIKTKVNLVFQWMNKSISTLHCVMDCLCTYACLANQCNS